MSLPDLHADTAWRSLAACRGLDANLFIPEGGGNGGLLYIEARKVCDVCPVSKPCLDFALANREELGMWGGTTPQDRQAIGYGPPTIDCAGCSRRVVRTSSHQKYCERACYLANAST